MLDTRMEPAVARDMVKGAADPLHSEFRLSGPMLLNLTRLESWSPDVLLLRSFRQFQAERDAPAQLRKAALLRVLPVPLHVCPGFTHVYRVLERMPTILKRCHQHVS